MSISIIGPSSATEYQLVKYSQTNNFYQEDILNLYITYAVEFNIKVDVAYAMSLIYTNYFNNRIMDNNLVGIGLQEEGTFMEGFDSIENCIIAQMEILKRGYSEEYVTDKPHSNLYRRVPAGKIKTTEDLFSFWKYDELTNFTVYDFNKIIREIERTRKGNPEWQAGGNNKYYYVRVKSSTSKSEIIQLRSDLRDKNFSMDDMYIKASDGLYTLEIGKQQSPSTAAIILKNLQLYGYNGEIKYRKSSDE